MRIHEHQAKQLFAAHGIPIPRGDVALSPEDTVDVARYLSCPVVVKAQVPVGGRGIAGGIQFADNPPDTANVARRIIGMELKGYTVHRVLVEEQLDIAEEYYIGFTIDRSQGLPVAIMSSMGGVDIEEIAIKSPEKISQMVIDPLWGFHEYQIKNLIYRSGIHLTRQVIDIIKALWGVFQHFDATLAEINPLVVTREGNVVAGDAKFTIDDNALPRQPELAELAESDVDDPLERLAHSRRLEYVRLDGSVGVIGNGAGLVMATLDSIALEGGRAANFLDVGGGARADAVAAALEIVLADWNVRSVLFNIFGGITRCDEVAKGILAAIDLDKPRVPVVVRLAGTNEVEGRRLLEGSGLHIVETMEEAAQTAVALAEGSP